MSHTFLGFDSSVISCSWKPSQGVMSKMMGKGISTRNQTSFSLKPSWTMLLILKPCVGMVWVMSSEVKVLRMVVFPALSKPRTRIRASISSWSCSGDESIVGSLVGAYCHYYQYVDVICPFHLHTNSKTVFVWERISNISYSMNSPKNLEILCECAIFWVDLCIEYGIDYGEYCM